LVFANLIVAAPARIQNADVWHMYCAYVILASIRDTAVWYALQFVVEDDEIGA
jgi:hypothetical protein